MRDDTTTAMIRYKLRTLLIAVTLAGLLLGGRVEYLRSQATYHANEAFKSSVTHGSYGDFLYHDQFARNYRYTVVRPWSIVKAPSPPVRGDK